MMITTVISSCTKDDNQLSTESSEFTLTSSAIAQDSLLPSKYTCDGESATLPLSWSNPPDSTVVYTLIMHHEAAPDDVHCYWIVYNIPADISELPENVSGIGSLGTNTVNGLNEYTPPCSKGPGEKEYHYTLYALSEKLDITASPDEIDMDFIKEAMVGKIISTANMTVYYTRQYTVH